jgi:hypothetical protein
MTPEEQAKLADKRWLSRARTVRPPIARAIARAMGVGELDITFADLNSTKGIAELFAHRAKNAMLREVPGRSAAVRLVQAHLGGRSASAFLLPDGYHDSGAVPVDFAGAIAHLDALLSSQNEVFRLISVTGDEGVCIFTQEGTDEDYPRFVELWETKDGSVDDQTSTDLRHPHS